jgi:hypothetical protein
MAGQPLVDEADREGQKLLEQHGSHEHGQRPHRAGEAGDPGPLSSARPGTTVAQANSSLITLPELAIFIGRPFLLVKVVSSEMSRALSTLAIRSCEL